MELNQEMLEAVKAVKTTYEKQQEEIRAFGKSTEETAKELKAAGARVDAVQTELKQANEQLAERLGKLEAAANRPRYDAPRQQKMTPGMQFVASEQYKTAQAANANEIGRVNVGDMFSLKALPDPVRGDLGYDASPVNPYRVPDIFFDPGQRMMTLRDVMNVAPVSSNAVEFVMETEFDEDGAASQVHEGAPKPQAAMDFELKTAPVVTIAHWMPASRQVLADAAMLQSYIDGRLTYSVQKELEDQILFGSGANGQMLGVHNTPGVVTVGAPDGTDTIIDHIRRSIGLVRSSEYMATGIILNPQDWATIELIKGSDDHYVWVSVPDGGVSRLWRVPVIETTAMQEGRFLIGAFGLGAQLWDRQQATIRVSEHHEDYFTRNIVAILAELRMALTVYRPRAFVKGTFTGDIST